MHATRGTRRIQLWSDWLLLIAAPVALFVPIDLVADATYHSDGTVLYWLLVAYSYADGTPAATVVGLAVLALALLAYWISLRLLARIGVAPLRALALLALTLLASVSAVLTLLLAPLVSDGNPLFSGPVILGQGLLTVALVLGLLAVVRGARERRKRPGRCSVWWRSPSSRPCSL
ncbi:MAG TPA: hypothetical protein VGP82_04390 [Ktedonobacterales bacterium]|nr:hypothetical protein [Ktedonobacterales bacterium]